MSFQVLIIDDDASFRKLLELRLRSFLPNLSLTSFEDLGSARAHLQSSPPADLDLVVIDEHLPDGRGGEFLSEGWFRDIAVLAVSSDSAPEIPGHSLSAGATFFLNKVHISEPLFRPLVEGIIQRNKLQRQLVSAAVGQAKMDTVRTLVSTLRHEINNPLGAVLGAAYLLRTTSPASGPQKEAAELVESSGHRIKEVLEKLCEAVSVEEVTKADQQVFHIPGDKPWDDKK